VGLGERNNRRIQISLPRKRDLASFKHSVLAAIRSQTHVAAESARRRFVD